jgi:drug efflux transport system permease protein
VSPARVLALALKEWREIVRDRIYFSLAFVMPVMLMMVFGYGISQSIEHMPLVVVDHDRSAASRGYADRFAASEHFELRGVVDSEREAAALLGRGAVHVVIVVGSGFAEDLASGRGAVVQTLVDGSFTQTRVPRTLEAYVEAVNAAASAELGAAWLARRLGLPPDRAAALLRPVKLDVRYLYNPELKSIWSVAPSLIMFILIFVAPMLTALGVVREKESGAIYNVYASTLTRGEYVLGKLAPNVLIAGVNAVILWLLAILYFGAPFRGGLACFATGTFLYLVCTTSLGLLVSLAVQTQTAALMITSIGATILGFQYSGFFNPVQSMSGVPWLIAHAFPPMYYLDVVEGAFLKGLGFGALAEDLGALSAFAALYLVLAHALFRKRRRA